MQLRRFAFVIHPLTIREIHAHPLYRWTRLFPDALVERVAAWMPPIFIARITGMVSPATGQRAEGLLYALSATPRQMLARRPEFTYRRVLRAARLAARRGARILGLGAFTSVVGDAGHTIARRAPIAVTSGNSLTAAAAVEAARVGMAKMGLGELRGQRVMVVGATGSIGSAVARLVAEECGNLVLISRTREKLAALRQQLLARHPAAAIRFGTDASEFLADCSVVISATSAFGERVLDVCNANPAR